MKKVLALTSIRSDFDLMSPLFHLLHNSAAIDLQLIVSGAHLAPTYGYTVKDIETQGFNIFTRIETLLDSDTNSARIKSASLLLIGLVDLVANYQPDLIIYAGDREDTLIGAMLGTYLSTPTIHFFAGDHAADGYVDNPVRHAVSKLSTAMFVSTESHKQRLMKIGEPANRIHVIGSVALDKFVQHQPASKQEILNSVGVDVSVEKYAIVIFHPVEAEKQVAPHYLENIIESLLAKGIMPLISSPNPDPGNRNLIKVCESYAEDPRVHFYGNLEIERFLSLFKNASLIIGNSSAGLLEAASIPIATINVGLRQRGRMHTDNVQFCDGEKDAILQAIDIAMARDFQQIVSQVKNPYGDGRSAERAFELIEQLDLKPMVYKPEDPLMQNDQP